MCELKFSKTFVYEILYFCYEKNQLLHQVSSNEGECAADVN